MKVIGRFNFKKDGPKFVSTDKGRLTLCERGVHKYVNLHGADNFDVVFTDRPYFESFAITRGWMVEHEVLAEENGVACPIVFIWAVDDLVTAMYKKGARCVHVEIDA